MRDVVTRREFEWVPIGGDDGLREDELDHLARLRRGGPAFYTEERRDGRWHCRFAGFVGAVALRAGARSKSCRSAPARSSSPTAAWSCGCSPRPG